MVRNNNLVPVIEDQYEAARVYFGSIIGLLLVESAIRLPQYIRSAWNRGPYIPSPTRHYFPVVQVHKLLTLPSPIPHVTSSVSSLLRLAIFLALNILFGWNRIKYTGDYKLYGWLTIANAGLALLLSVRGTNLLSAVTRIPSPLLLQYHRWCGMATVTHATIHFALNTQQYIATNQLADVYASLRIQLGVMSWISLALMLLTSFAVVRRRWFEGFWYPHATLFFIFTVGALIHASNGPEFLLPGLLLWGVDRIWRLAQSWLLTGASVQVVSAEHFRAGDVVKLRFAAGRGIATTSPGADRRRGADTRMSLAPHHPGQIAWLHLTAAGRAAWHPFTLASAPGDALTTVAIRGLGGYTRRLQVAVTDKIASAAASGAEDGSNMGIATTASTSPVMAKEMMRGAGPAMDNNDNNSMFVAPPPPQMSPVPMPMPKGAIRLRVDGPHGVGGLRWGQHAVTALVAGGIGITPGISIAGYIIRRAAALAHAGRVSSSGRNGETKAPPPAQGQPQTERPAWHVHILWVMKDLHNAEWFEPELAELARLAADPVVPATLTIDIYATNHKQPQHHHHQHHHQHGGHPGDIPLREPQEPQFRYTGPGNVHLGRRPDVLAWLRDEVKARHAPGLDAAVNACGPKRLVQDVRRAAVSVSDGNGLYYIEEEKFEF